MKKIAIQKARSKSPDPLEPSLLAQFDDLIRNNKTLNVGEEKEFLTFVRSSRNLVRTISQSEGANQRLELELEKLTKENTGEVNINFLPFLTIHL